MTPITTVIVVAVVGAAVIVGGSIVYVYMTEKKWNFNPMVTVPALGAGIKTKMGL